MTEISAKVVLHSRSRHHNKTIATLQLVYPRFIHAEAKTHRVLSIGGNEYEMMQDVSFMNDSNLSRNAMSSRAVPVAKMIEQVRNDPAMPIHWGANQPGMQAGTEVGPLAKQDAQQLWRQAANVSADIATAMSADLGLHKQVVNRILEPFQWMNTIVTATEWANFFQLRLDHMAEPNMRRLAECMRKALYESEPVLRDFHAPYVTDEEFVTLSRHDAGMVSAARCARVSFLNHDGSAPNVEKDLALAKTLYESRHASPFEHIADEQEDQYARSRNFVGWTQFRESIGL